MSTLTELESGIEWALSDHSEAELLAWASRPTELTPWLSWTVIALIRHRDRQRWVAEIVTKRLSGNPEALSVAGALAHPEERSQRGVVPGLIDWEYYFHGRGCCVTHRRTGESIDVDFFDDTGDYCDPWFFVGFLESLKSPEPVEKRLLELHPSPGTVQITIEELLQKDVLDRRAEHSSVFRLSAECDLLAGPCDRFVEAWDTSKRRLQLAVGIGDWAAACELAAGNEPLKALFERQLERGRADRTKRLRRLLADTRLACEALEDMGQNDSSEFDRAAAAALQGSPSGLMNRTLDLIRRKKDARWCEAVFGLFLRLDPSRDIPEPAAWISAAEYLLQHGFRGSEVARELQRATNRSTAEAGLLALEYCPAAAPNLFQKALHSTIPGERLDAAAILGILDEFWGRQLMLSVLEGCDDQEATSECRAALTASSEPQARLAVAAWEQTHPYEPESGPYYSMLDVALHNADAYVQYRMSEMHDRLLRLRNRVR